MTAPDPLVGVEAVGTRAEFVGEWPVVRALYGMCGRRRWLLAVIVSLAAVAFLLEGIGIGLLIPLFQTLFAPESQAGAAGPFTGIMLTFTERLPSEHRLAVLAGLVFVLILLKSVVIYAHHIISVWLSGHVGLDLRQMLFRRALGIGVLAMQTLGIGRLHNTIDAQVWSVTEGLDTLTGAIASAAAAAVFLTLLLLISWPLTLAVITGAVAISLLMLAVRRAAQHLGRAMVMANAELSARIVEALTHHRLVRAFGTEAHEAGRFGAAAEALRRAVLRTELLRGIVTPFTELMYVPLMFAVIALGLALGYGMASLVAYLLLLYRLAPHFRHIDHLRVELAALTGPIEDVVTTLALPLDTPARLGARPIHRIERSIRFDDVSFAYGPGTHGPGTGGQGRAADLSGVSFEIPKGAVVALVGPSGAGKTTIVGLLYRFFDPSHGRIVVDGVPLPEVDIASWRQRLAFAGQDVELMSGTVRDNIRYGSFAASEADIVAAARLANADGFISALADGYDSMVGARGLSLSGGQRQRLTLARALLRQPDLLILDEATNALDMEAEQVVLDRLHAGRGDMSTLVIAHRSSSIRHADVVVLLDHGRIVEIGPPAALIGDTGMANSGMGDPGLLGRPREQEGGPRDSDREQSREPAA
jgi:subfamily B ATP-binding cassette protein MsbA